MTKRKRVRLGESGAALVEFAISAPLLVLLMTGTIGFAFSISERAAMSQAANIAARTAVRQVGASDAQMLSVSTEIGKRALENGSMNRNHYSVNAARITIGDELEGLTEFDAWEVTVTKNESLLGFMNPFQSSAKSVYRIHEWEEEVEEES